MSSRSSKSSDRPVADTDQENPEQNKKGNPGAGEASASGEQATFDWSKGTRRFVSGLIALHLIAVMAAPMANPDPASRLAKGVAYVAHPYLLAMFLDHGYRFFAPEPGPSHVIRYEIFQSREEMAAELPDIEGVFPDRDEFWPRQLYHRWFMLSETVNAVTSPIPSEEEHKQLNEQARQEIERLKAAGDFEIARVLEQDVAAENERIEFSKLQQARLLEAIGQHLLDLHDGQRIKIYLRQRQLPSMVDVQNGKTLDDEIYFNSEFELFLGSTVRDNPE